MVRFTFAAFHSMRLSSTCLPICKDGAIVACQDTLDNGQGSFFEDIFLQTTGLKGHIEAENSFLVTGIFDVMDSYLSSLRIDLDDLFESFADLSRCHGSASDGHLNALFLRHEL